MKPENLTCPTCGGPMLRRSNRQTGRPFWGCKAFPACRGTRNTDGEAVRPYEVSGTDASDRYHEPEDVLPSQRRRQSAWDME
jgi:ssDNA-binding Zn-finger/Zn-ribbon topoisomerase 1